MVTTLASSLYTVTSSAVYSEQLSGDLYTFKPVQLVTCIELRLSGRMVSLCSVLCKHLLKLKLHLVSHLSLRRSLKPHGTLVSGARRSFSCQPSGFLLELPQYRRMRETLAGRKGDLGILESAGLFVLEMENLKVTATALHLNLVSQASIDGSEGPRSLEIMRLRAAGGLKIGKYTSAHDDLILSAFHNLCHQIAADQKALESELFSPGRHKICFLLQQNLVGFYLLQKLED